MFPYYQVYEEATNTTPLYHNFPPKLETKDLKQKYPSQLKMDKVIYQLPSPTSFKVVNDAWFL